MRISVIIPIYNAEKYLARCINSILPQDIYEIILINDGSKDKSGEICDEFVKQDNRLKIFHRENKDVSAARNFGIEQAKGEWIVFVDADDWVETNWIDVLKQNIEQYELNLYVFSVRRVTSNNQISSHHLLPQIIESTTNFVRTGYYNFAVWAYVFKRSIISQYNIRFPEGLKYSEDQAFLLKYFSVCDKIVLIENILYNYYNYPSSTVSQNISTFPWAMSNLIVANDFLQFCKLHNVSEEFYGYPVKRLYESFLFYYSNIKNVNKKDASKQYRKEYKKSLQYYPQLKMQSTFRLASYHLSFPIFFQFRKNLKRIFNKPDKL